MNVEQLANMIDDPDGTAFALATVDEKTGGWFLMRGCSLGNPMRTRSQVSVMTWREKSMIHDWLTKLPDRTKKEMEERQLFIVPIKLSVLSSESFDVVTITSRQVPSEEKDAPPITEFNLTTEPLGKRGGKKRSK